MAAVFRLRRGRTGAELPDDGKLMDLFAAFCDDEDLRRKILVDNPTRLYWTPA